MRTIDKGNRAVAAAVGKLSALGYVVLMPVGEGYRYDLVIEKDGRFQRVQVKSVSVLKKTGCLTVPLCSMPRNSRRQRYLPEEVDAILVHYVTGGRWFWLSLSDQRFTGKNSIELRVKAPRNTSPTVQINRAGDFEV